MSTTTTRRTRALAAAATRKPVAAPAIITPPANIDDWEPRYGLIMSGACMEPTIPDGSVAVFSTVEPYAEGDIVVIHFRPEVGRPSVTKRLIMPPPPWVKFPYKENPKSEAASLVMCAMDNPRRMVAYECRRIRAIHKFIGLVPARASQTPTTERGRAGR